MTPTETRPVLGIDRARDAIVAEAATIPGVEAPAAPPDVRRVRPGRRAMSAAYFDGVDTRARAHALVAQFRLTTSWADPARIAPLPASDGPDFRVAALTVDGAPARLTVRWDHGVNAYLASLECHIEDSE